jgi:hypothetical protein
MSGGAMAPGGADDKDIGLVPDDSDPAVAALLEDLNQWIGESGLDPNHPDSEVRSTGESNAAIADLKRQLAERGARIRWVAGSGRYELDPGHG